MPPLTGGCQEVTRGVHGQECQAHINYLELMAAFLAFISNRRRLNVLLCIDNVTAIAFINRMGGTHSTLSLDVWQWCLERDHYPCQARTQEREHSSRLGISTLQQIQRLKTQEDVFQLLEKWGPLSI